MKKNYLNAVLAVSFLLFASIQSCRHESLETEMVNVRENPISFIKNEYMKGKDIVVGKLIEWDKIREYKKEGDIILVTVPIKNEQDSTIEELTFRIDKNKVSGHLWKFKSDVPFTSEDYKLTAHEIMENMTGTVSYVALEGSMRYEKKMVRGKFIDEVARSGSGPMNSPSCKPCHGEIKEIVITAPGGGGPTNPFPDNPIPGGVGGGNNPQTPDNNDNNDPCKKGKKVQNGEDFKKKMDDLKDHAKNGKGEKGFKAKADGTTSEMISGGDHSVKLGDKTGYQGGSHNHTRTGIPIHSPADIDMLLGFARAQGNQGNNAQNAFFGMVDQFGNQYVAWFNGSYQDAIKNFSQEQIKKLTDDYRKKYSDLLDIAEYSSDGGATLNNKGLEKLFSETVKNMGLDGKIGLQRIDPKNKVSNINYDSVGKPTEVPCPN